MTQTETKKKDLEEEEKTNKQTNRTSKSNHIKCPNICVIGIPERGEKNKKAEEIHEELITENFPKLMTDSKSHIQKEEKKVSRHIICKLLGTKSKEQS